jgi:exopolyphosphatase/guanosine-5'-triphosphate,3'-diphosphate pyrophosphatase
MRRAVIDIGTNTVKLLVADVRDGQVFPVVTKDQTTRLGEGVDQTRLLSPPAIQRTVAAIAGYIADTREHGVTDIRALATSAVRTAGNSAEFLAAVRQATGLTVEVITGEREAELIFAGVTSEPALHRQPLLVMDIGGGSVEFIQGSRTTIEHRTSLPVGAVRMTEKYGDNFSALAEHFRNLFRQALRPFNATGRQFIATGGANITLVRIAKSQTDHAALTFDEVLALVARLHALTLAERRQLPGMPADRADIIVAGAAALVFAMETLSVHTVTVSTRNLRYGALLTMNQAPTK